MENQGRSMKFLNLFRLLMKRFDALQLAGDSFWKTADNSFLAKSEYYIRRTAVLEKVLPVLPPLHSAIDVGCGNGSFTFMLGRCAQHITGYDLSPELIKQARENTPEGSAAFDFSVGDIESPPEYGPFDLVACIGVLSCLVAEDKYQRVAVLLRELVKPNGYLLLVDTLGKEQEISRAYRNGYVARYRSVVEYERLWRDKSLSLMRKVQILEMDQELENNFYLYQQR